jgi:hypothetical protein
MDTQTQIGTEMLGEKPSANPSHSSVEQTTNQETRMRNDMTNKINTQQLRTSNRMSTSGIRHYQDRKPSSRSFQCLGGVHLHARNSFYAFSSNKS